MLTELLRLLLRHYCKQEPHEMRRNEDDDWQPVGARIPALPVRAVGLAPASCTGAICPPSRVSARRRTRHSDYLSVSRTILSSNLETRYAARCGAHGLFPRGACCIYSAHPCTDCVQVRRVQGMALRVNEELASQACQQSTLFFCRTRVSSHFIARCESLSSRMRTP